LGEMAGPMLLAGQRVVPRRALDAGFSFQFTEIGAAMRDAVR
jgi:NAD dependent epimerase/dehydratase family enzyme